MIKSIGNSESVSSNFDNLLSNLEKGKIQEVEAKAAKTNKQTSDEFHSIQLIAPEDHWSRPHQSPKDAVKTSYKL